MKYLTFTSCNFQNENWKGLGNCISSNCLSTISRRHGKKCKVCQRFFKTSHDLRNHLQTHHKLFCETCGNTFIDSVSGRKHLDKHVKSCVIYKCNLCDKTFLSLKELKAHMPTHKPICSKCDRGFIGKSAKALQNDVQLCANHFVIKTFQVSKAKSPHTNSQTHLPQM